MTTFETIVLAVYHQVMVLLHIPMSLGTNLFIVDEEEWLDVKPQMFNEVALNKFIHFACDFCIILHDLIGTGKMLTKQHSF